VTPVSAGAQAEVRDGQKMPLRRITEASVLVSQTPIEPRKAMFA
jgi:hypothetical protein